MWLEAIIPKEDLAALLDELTPLSFALGDEGRLWLSEPSEVELVEDAGLRVRCSARFRLPLLGFHLPVKVHTATVLLRPEVAEGPHGPALVFALEIEHADFAVLPDVVDAMVTDRINHELAKRRGDLAWSYAQTLSHVFELPGRLDPVEALVIQAAHARVKTTRTALALAVEMSASARRGGAASASARPARSLAPARAPGAANDGLSAVRRRPLTSARAPSRLGNGARLQRGAAFAGVVAAALAGGFVLGRRAMAR